MFKWLNRLVVHSKNATPRRWPPAPVPEDEILREFFSPSQEEIVAFRGFLEVVLAPLDTIERNRLIGEAVTGMAPGDSTTTVLQWVFEREPWTPEDVDLSTWWLCIAGDWKAVEEIDWQANKMLRALGVQETWCSHYLERPAPLATADAILLDLDSWLSSLGFRLLFVDTGRDDYFSLPVAQSSLNEALKLAADAKLELRDAATFRRFCDLD